MSDCILWTGSYDNKGYGRIKIKGKTYKAHRYEYERVFGPIPEGLFICHRCGNPGCVNPDHLYAGTQKENCKDRDMHGRTPKGTEHARARMTVEGVLTIRKRGESGERFKVIAKDFGISDTQVRNIVRRRQWVHV